MMRQSDSLEDLTLDGETTLDGDNDIDLDKELGLSEATPVKEKEKEKVKEKEKEKENEREKEVEIKPKVEKVKLENPPVVQQEQQGQQQQQQQQQSSWWGGIWNTATQVVTTAAANPNEITKALQTAVSNTKIQEGIKTMSVAAKSVAHLVEENVEKLIDAIDVEDEEDDGQIKQKVIVGSINPEDVTLVAEVLETMYKEDKFSVKGMSCDSGVAKQPIGFENGIAGAKNRIQSIISHDSIQQMDSFYVISIEQFVVKVGDLWFESNCVAFYDKKTNSSFHNFSQMMPVSSKIVEKAIKLTPSEYPLRESGASITVASLIEMDNSGSKWQNEKDWYPSKTDGRMDKYTIMKMAIATVLGLNDNDTEKS